MITVFIDRCGAVRHVKLIPSDYVNHPDASPAWLSPLWDYFLFAGQPGKTP
jgi:hypothetical protein